MHNFTKAVVLLVASFLISCELSAFAFEKRPYSAALLEKAKQGDAKSQVGLGLCYERGEGVPQDKVEAYALYNLASVKNELARNFRDSIAKEMTPDQITAAEKRTLEHQKEFKPN